MSAYNPQRPLKLGDSGGDVLAAQIGLPYALKVRGLGATVKATGTFDEATAADVRALTGAYGRSTSTLSKAMIAGKLAPWYAWVTLREAALAGPQPELRRPIVAKLDAGADVLACKHGLRALMLERGRLRAAPAPDFGMIRQGGVRFHHAIVWLQSEMGWKRTGTIGQLELGVLWAFMSKAQRAQYATGSLDPRPPRPRPQRRHPRDRAVDLMLSWEGKTESPPESNIFPPVQGAVARLVKRGVKVPGWQLRGGFAWCVWACFVALADSGSVSATNTIERGNAAYTVAVLDAARKGKFGLSITTRPRRGDIALFDLPAGDDVDHAGLVLSATRSTVTCIEGNTSSGSLGSQDNGGGCYRRTRDRRIVRAFVRVGS
jgi:hypothetical protein